MKIISFYGLLVLALSFVLPMRMDCMQRRGRIAPSRQQPPRPQPLPQSDDDEFLRRAIALSLEPSDPDEDPALKAPLEAKIESVNRLPELLRQYQLTLDEKISSVYQNQPEHVWQQAGELYEMARRLLTVMENYIPLFLDCAMQGEPEQYDQLYREMLNYFHRLLEIGELFRTLSSGLFAIEQPVAFDFQLPLSIQNHGIVVRHLKTGGQVDATCGAHAVINVRAIQMLLESKVKLTSDAIRAQAATLHPYIQRANFLTEEVYEFAKRIGLKRGFIFEFNSEKKEFAEIGRPAGFDRIASKQEILTLLKTIPAGDYYFVLNTGGHWVVLAVIKLIGQPSQIICLDSGNGPLADGGMGVQFFQYLFNEIFFG